MYKFVAILRVILIKALLVACSHLGLLPFFRLQFFTATYSNNIEFKSNRKQQPIYSLIIVFLSAINDLDGRKNCTNQIFSPDA